MFFKFSIDFELYSISKQVFFVSESFMSEWPSTRGGTCKHRGERKNKRPLVCVGPAVIFDDVMYIPVMMDQST